MAAPPESPTPIPWTCAVIARELWTTWTEAGLVALSATLMLLGIVVIVRIAGLRSFSKMSSFDFAVTVAFGSLLASVALSSSSLVDGLVAGATLIVVQVVIALGRSRLGLARAVDNEPMLLMSEGRMLDANLRRARVTEDDIRAKLREANVLSYRQVRAVVLETTGDISVLHGSGDVDPDLLADVRHP